MTTKSNLHSVKTAKQWEKIKDEIDNAIEQLIDGDGDPTQNLALLINHLSNETESRDRMRDMALEATFRRTGAYDDAFATFLGYETQPAKQRKRA